MKITTDEQYNKSLAWMVDRAQRISNPLADPQQRAKDSQLYETVEKEVKAYSQKSTGDALPYPYLQIIGVEPEKKSALAEWLE